MQKITTKISPRGFCLKNMKICLLCLCPATQVHCVSLFHRQIPICSCTQNCTYIIGIITWFLQNSLIWAIALNLLVWTMWVHSTRELLQHAAGKWKMAPRRSEKWIPSCTQTKFVLLQAETRQKPSQIYCWTVQAFQSRDIAYRNWNSEVSRFDDINSFTAVRARKKILLTHSLLLTLMTFSTLFSPVVSSHMGALFVTC